MRKALWITTLAVVLIGTIIYGVYLFSIPASEKINKQYLNHLKSWNDDKAKENPAYRYEFQSKSEELQVNLAFAYSNEKKYDDAINVIEHLLQENRELHYGQRGQIRLRGSWFYRIEARYLGMLADIYHLKNDFNRRDEALKKMALAQKKEEFLRKIESSRR